MGKHKILLAVLYVLILGFHVVHCANILIYGMHAAGSHTQNIAYVGEALIRHGHSVDVLTVSSDKFIHLYTELGVPTLEPVIINYENEDILPHFFDNKLTYGEAFEKMVGTNAAQCDAVLQHKKHLRDTLKPYDIAVTDAVCHCCAMLLKYIGIPYVLLHTMKDVGYATDVTAPLSYYPIEETTMMLTNKMTFTDRLQNTLASLLLPSYKDINMAFLRLYHKHNITPGIYSFQQASLHLLVKDFTIDYVHPLIPNVVPIGLLTTRPANGLPSELEEFMHSSGNEGVIVVSLGTCIRFVPIQTLDIILSTLARFPLKIVFSYSGPTPPGFSDNIKIVKWVNQNDILGHPKTRLFLTHGGTSSYREAIYHGVPMVCIPLMFDQYDTAAKIISKGVGSYVKMKSLNNENLYEAMVEVLSNKKYSEKAKQLSAIVKDVPMNATDTAVFWIEHVLQHGVTHLTFHEKQLSVIEYYLLDVLTVIAGTICIIFWSLRWFVVVLKRSVTNTTKYK